LFVFCQGLLVVGCGLWVVGCGLWDVVEQEKLKKRMQPRLQKFWRKQREQKSKPSGNKEVVLGAKKL